MKSEEDLNRTVRPEEEIGVLLRAFDEDENLSHLVLRGRRGDEIVRLECQESQLSQCTGRLHITAPGRADKTLKFSAVAVDHRQGESAPIFLTITTEKRRVVGGGGGSGGGSSSSQPTPTPFPLPAVSLESGQATLGGAVELALTIDKVPAGLSGYDVKVSVTDPTIGKISAVRFPPEFESFSQVLLFPPFSEVGLTAVDISRDVQPGDTNVVLALITFEGSKQGVTSIEVSDDTKFGIQDEGLNMMSVTTTNGELTVP